jgi:hypothetical protein
MISANLFTHAQYLKCDETRVPLQRGNVQKKDTSCFKKIGHCLRNRALILKNKISNIANSIFFIFQKLGDGIYCIIGKIQVRDTLKDCHYQFASQVFETYRSQLKSYIEEELKSRPALQTAIQNNSTPGSSFQKQTLKLIKNIRIQDKGNVQHQRTFHQNMMKELRSLSIQMDKQKKSHNTIDQEMTGFIEGLIVWQYTKPDLWGSMNQFISSHSSVKYGNETVKPKSVLECLSQTYKSFKNKSKIFPGILSFPSNLYDPHLLGDTPSALFTLKGKKDTLIIRTPSVTRDIKRDIKNMLIEVKIVEEFLSLLEIYQNTNKVHLYINLMNRRGGSEGLRSNTIEKLEHNPAYSKAIRCVTLDKDSDFYWQKGRYSNHSNYDEFKQAFLDSMFAPSEKSHFYWPQHLDSNLWKMKCEELIQEVHGKSFGNRTSMTIPERLNFIEITYDKIIRTLIDEIAPDTCNLSCKSCIDRGASALALTFALDKKVSENLSEEDKEKTVSLAIAPALLTMSRPPQLCRVERLIGALAVVSEA